MKFREMVTYLYKFIEKLDKFFVQLVNQGIFEEF